MSRFTPDPSVALVDGSGRPSWHRVSLDLSDYGGHEAVLRFFVNATSAGIQLVPGTLFVIEMQGQNTGTGIQGTYVPPTSGGPAYAEPLFLNGPGCFADCG